MFNANRTILIFLINFKFFYKLTAKTGVLNIYRERGGAFIKTKILDKLYDCLDEKQNKKYKEVIKLVIKHPQVFENNDKSVFFPDSQMPPIPKSIKKQIKEMRRRCRQKKARRLFSNIVSKLKPLVSSK